MAGSLPEETIRVLALDRSGQLWLGGDALGISHTDPAGARFRYVVDGDTSRRYTETNNIRSIHEDAAGDLWIGTEGDGLKRYERASGRFEYHGDALGAALPAEDQGRPLRVYALAAADPARLWVATNLGAFLYEPATRHAELLPHGPGRADALPDRHVRAVVAGRDGSVWFGTSEGGSRAIAPPTGAGAISRAFPATRTACGIRRSWPCARIATAACGSARSTGSTSTTRPATACAASRAAGPSVNRSRATGAGDPPVRRWHDLDRDPDRLVAPR